MDPQVLWMDQHWKRFASELRRASAMCKVDRHLIIALLETWFWKLKIIKSLNCIYVILFITIIPDDTFNVPFCTWCPCSLQSWLVRTRGIPSLPWVMPLIEYISNEIHGGRFHNILLRPPYGKSNSNNHFVHPAIICGNNVWSLPYKDC